MFHKDIDKKESRSIYVSYTIHILSFFIATNCLKGRDSHSNDLSITVADADSRAFHASLGGSGLRVTEKLMNR